MKIRNYDILSKNCGLKSHDLKSRNYDLVEIMTYSRNDDAYSKLWLKRQKYCILSQNYELKR